AGAPPCRIVEAERGGREVPQRPRGRTPELTLAAPAPPGAGPGRPGAATTSRLRRIFDDEATAVAAGDRAGNWGRPRADTRHHLRRRPRRCCGGAGGAAMRGRLHDLLRQRLLSMR